MIERLEAGGVGVLLANPSGPITIHFLFRNHKKLAVIDDRISYIGGINYSDHNFEWHDMMLRIEDEGVARFLAEDFDATWSGISHTAPGRFDGIEIHRFDGRHNRKGFEPVLDLIRGARDNVTIVSPYITYPFFGALNEAHKRGVKVTLIAPDNNNWNVLWEYVVWETTKSGIELMLYEGPMSHLKAMLIDDQYLVLGSSNFDFLSYCHLQEIVGVVTAPEVIADFKSRIIEPDLMRSRRSQEHVPNWKGLYNLARLKTMSAIFQGVDKIIPARR
jgi:cardiolipin synthase